MTSSEKERQKRMFLEFFEIHFNQARSSIAASKMLENIQSGSCPFLGVRWRFKGNTTFREMGEFYKQNKQELDQSLISFLKKEKEGGS